MEGPSIFVYPCMSISLLSAWCITSCMLWHLASHLGYSACLVTQNRHARPFQVTQNGLEKVPDWQKLGLFAGPMGFDHPKKPQWLKDTHVSKDTLLGTNMEVENGPLEYHFPLQTGGAIHFHVSSRESIKCWHREI